MSSLRQVLIILEINLQQEFDKAQTMAKDLAEILGIENPETPIKFAHAQICQVGVCGLTDQSHSDIYSALSLAYKAAQIVPDMKDHTLVYAADKPIPAFHVKWGF